MKLTEAFRYQNHLSHIFDNAIMFLNTSANMVDTIQQHLRSRSNPDAADETISLEVDRRVDCSPDYVVKFALALIEEKHKVSRAITLAKAAAEFSVDAEQMANRMRYQLNAALTTSLRAYSDSVRTLANAGTGYKFNVEGAQVPYKYDIVQEAKVRFDRAEMKKISKELLLECNAISVDLDRNFAEIEVDHQPAFSIADSFEDAIEAFISGEREDA